MTDIRDLLKQKAQEYSLSLNDRMLEQFQLYLEDLLEVNQVMNLTAITEPDEVAVKHFLDSILFLSVIEPKEKASLADVGTGAGFPGVPLKIARPDLDLYLIDSLQKRLNFLDNLLQKLGLEGKTVHSRAEDCGREAQYREKFDVVTARAVANLSALSEYCLPLVKKGGYFVAMKSLKTEEELESAKNAITLLGGKIEKVETITLDGEMSRSFIIIKKVKETPQKYPRRGVKIAKNPL